MSKAANALAVLRIWRIGVAKSVFVAKDAATAKAYATDPNGPMFITIARCSPLKRGGRIELKRAAISPTTR
jgi:hypothetical protein